MKKAYLFLIQALMALSLVCATGCSKGEDDPYGKNVGEDTFANTSDDDSGTSDTSGGSFKIGQSYQGGIIFYIDDTGKHGLIVTSEDQSPGMQWYNGSYIATGATGTMIGTGKDNTTKIVQAQGEGNYAAKLCDDLVFNGYSDWYLPSLNELSILYLNRDVIGYYTAKYWSSSESDNYNAWYQNFNDGSQGSGNSKSNAFRVRAVRAF